MANCSKCKKKLGLLDSKHKIKDGNEVLCPDCFPEWEREQEKKAKTKLKKILLKNIQWEYKILNLKTIGSGLNASGNKIKPEDENELNKLGLEGWELVSAVTMNSLAVRFGTMATATEFVSCVFKRKLC